MACDAFEDRLIDYADLSIAERRLVDAHLADCEDCRSYFDTLLRLDVQLEGALTSLAAPAGFRDGVLRGIRTPAPSRIPEMLDALGWMGIVALVGGRDDR